jgi:hypothetical protein
MSANDLIACELAWSRNGAEWVLRHNRRRMGQVVPDNKYPGMYRVALSHGSYSDMSNLSWAKSKLLVAATRDLVWELRHQGALNPTKCPENRGVFVQIALPARLNEEGTGMIPLTTNSNLTAVSSNAM